MKLADISRGAEVILDTRVLLRALAEESAECRALLQRCFSREIRGIVPLPALWELNHQLMALQARRLGKAQGANPAAWLNRHPGEIKAMREYREALEKLLQEELAFEPATAKDLADALGIQASEGFMATDSLLIAMCRRMGAAGIVSFDKALTRMPGLTVFTP